MCSVFVSVAFLACFAGPFSKSDLEAAVFRAQHFGLRSDRIHDPGIFAVGSEAGVRGTLESRHGSVATPRFKNEAHTSP